MQDRVEVRYGLFHQLGSAAARAGALDQGGHRRAPVLADNESGNRDALLRPGVSI